MSATRAYDPEAFNRLPFREKLDILYGVSATDKRDLILSSPDAERLVRSFAPESLFYTLKEIGLHDAAELLSLASGEQVCAVVDLDCWKKDRLDTTSLLDWLEVILEGGTRTLGEFLNTVDLPLLVVFLKRFIRVHRKDDPEEPPELEGPEIFELDEHYRIEFVRWDARSSLVRALLEGLYERDYSYFVTVMEEVWWGVESELEESSFQVRNGRLQDRGFPDYFEALEIYRPLPMHALPERTDRLGRRHGGANGEAAMPADRALVTAEEGRSFLSDLLRAAFDFDAQSELRHEMAFLTNRVMIAEGVDYADRESVAQAVRLAHDTVNLAVEHLSEGDRRRAAVLLEHHYIQHLFRAGWGLLLDLRRQARGVVESLEIPAGKLDFLDTPYRETLAGLLRPKPRFFEGIDRPGEIRYRPFATRDDLSRARRILVDVGWLPGLCRRLLGQSLAEVATLRPADADDFRLSAVFLTAFAHLSLGRPAAAQPLSPEDLRDLREATRDSATGRLRDDARDRFFAVAGREGVSFLDFCLARFESEFLGITDEVPDSRYLSCLMIGSPERLS